MCNGGTRIGNIRSPHASWFKVMPWIFLRSSWTPWEKSALGLEMGVLGKNRRAIGHGKQTKKMISPIVGYLES